MSWQTWSVGWFGADCSSYSLTDCFRNQQLGLHGKKKKEKEKCRPGLLTRWMTHRRAVCLFFSDEVRAVQLLGSCAVLYSSVAGMKHRQLCYCTSGRVSQWIDAMSEGLDDESSDGNRDVGIHGGKTNWGMQEDELRSETRTNNTSRGGKKMFIDGAFCLLFINALWFFDVFLDIMSLDVPGIIS